MKHTNHHLLCLEKKALNISWGSKWLAGLIPCLALVFLNGCAAVGPDYVPPEKPLSAQWHTPLEGGLAADPIDQEALSQWWRTLNDPVLSRLMEQAVAGNLDLKEAQARVREARAKRGIEEAGLFPYVDASGKITRSKGSQETGAGTQRTLYGALGVRGPGSKPVLP